MESTPEQQMLARAELLVQQAVNLTHGNRGEQNLEQLIAATNRLQSPPLLLVSRLVDLFVDIVSEHADPQWAGLPNANPPLNALAAVLGIWLPQAFDGDPDEGRRLMNSIFTALGAVAGGSVYESLTQEQRDALDCYLFTLPNNADQRYATELYQRLSGLSGSVHNPLTNISLRKRIDHVATQLPVAYHPVERWLPPVDVVNLGDLSDLTTWRRTPEQANLSRILSEGIRPTLRPEVRETLVRDSAGFFRRPLAWANWLRRTTIGQSDESRGTNKQGYKRYGEGGLLYDLGSLLEINDFIVACVVDLAVLSVIVPEAIAPRVTPLRDRDQWGNRLLASEPRLVGAANLQQTMMRASTVGTEFTDFNQTVIIAGFNRGNRADWHAFLQHADLRQLLTVFTEESANAWLWARGNFLLLGISPDDYSRWQVASQGDRLALCFSHIAEANRIYTILDRSHPDGLRPIPGHLLLDLNQQQQAAHLDPQPDRIAVDDEAIRNRLQQMTGIHATNSVVMTEMVRVLRALSATTIHSPASRVELYPGLFVNTQVKSIQKR